MAKGQFIQFRLSLAEIKMLREISPPGASPSVFAKQLFLIQLKKECGAISPVTSPHTDDSGMTTGMTTDKAGMTANEVGMMGDDYTRKPRFEQVMPLGLTDEVKLTLKALVDDRLGEAIATIAVVWEEKFLDLVEQLERQFTELTQSGQDLSPTSLPEQQNEVLKTSQFPASQPAPPPTPAFNTSVPQAVPEIESENQAATSDVDKSNFELKSDELIARSVVTATDDVYQRKSEQSNSTLTPETTDTLAPFLTSGNAEDIDSSFPSTNSACQAHQPDLFSSDDNSPSSDRTPERHYLSPRELSDLLSLTTRTVNEHASKGNQPFRDWTAGLGKGTYDFDITNLGSARLLRRFYKLSD